MHVFFNGENPTRPARIGFEGKRMRGAMTCILNDMESFGKL